MKPLKLFYSVLFLFFSLFSNSQETEYKIASWDYQTLVYYFPTRIESQIEQVLEDSLGISGDIDSIRITDPSPSNSESLPYLEYFISTLNGQVVVGHRIIKRISQTADLVDYFLTKDIGDEQEELGARAWKCIKPANCNGCKPHRTGFLGLGGVDSCPCSNNEEIFCGFERTGGAFPWAPVIGLIGVILTILLT